MLPDRQIELKTTSKMLVSLIEIGLIHLFCSP